MIFRRLKQIGLALCLIGSLMVGSASACICAHHREKVEAPKTSCHGTHQQKAPSAETTAARNAADTVDVHCVCFANLPQPYVVSKSAGKDLAAGDAIADPKQGVIVPEAATIRSMNAAMQHPRPDLFYRDSRNALLPSRAPPRL